MDDAEKDEAMVKQQTRIADLSNTVMVLTNNIKAAEREGERLARVSRGDGFKDGVAFVLKILLQELEGAITRGD